MPDLLGVRGQVQMSGLRGDLLFVGLRQGPQEGVQVRRSPKQKQIRSDQQVFGTRAAQWYAQIL